MSVFKRRAICAACLLLCACGNGTGTGGGAGAELGADGGSLWPDAATASGGAGGGAGNAAGGAAICEQYLDCAADTNPAGLAVIIAAYGKTGSCWAQGDHELCESACHAGIVALHQSAPHSEACNRCEQDSDCPTALPACDAQRRACVECNTDSNCHTSSAPACDSASQACVECTTNAHCTNPVKPVCDGEARSCVGCLQSSDCKSPGQAVCDPATHGCRGCKNDSECGTGACESGTCVECTTDAQCSSAKPHCNPMLRACVECVGDQECGAGVCFFGSCCGQNACATNGLECGLTADLACIFAPISCGACGGGKLCVTGQCLPSPTNTCNPAACPEKKCGYVPEKNSYQCVSKYPPSCESTKKCGTGYRCASHEFNGTKYYDCEQYCVTQADCPAIKQCKPLNGPTSYGSCQ